jgi:exosortase/archaeosortase family protein
MPIQHLKFNTALTGDKKAILTFFIRLSILFTVWFFVYALLLNPARIIDKPITDLITVTVVKCINVLSPSTAPVTWIVNSNNIGNNLIQYNEKAFGIYDVCNGIDLMFIYISILVLLPYPAKRKIVFSIAGVIVIILANIIRVCALYFIYVYQKSAFDFSHHYLFTILMYVLIFYGWLLFIKKKPRV